MTGCLRHVLSRKFIATAPAQVDAIVRAVHAEPGPRAVVLQHALAGIGLMLG